MKFLTKIAAGGAIFAASVLGGVFAAHGQAVGALPSVDLNRFAGSWYEIARIPNKREKQCLADVVDLIALADKKDHLLLVSTCHVKDNYTNVANADIKAEKNSGGGKLKVTYIWPFSEKEWILALGADYEWVLLGSPNHRALKLLSRTRSLRPEILSEIKQKAAAEGFATDKLAMTLQTGR